MFDFMKYTERLPCAKRTFGILILFGLFCSYIIYDIQSRNGYLVRVAKVKTMSEFPERRLRNTQPRELNRVVITRPSNSATNTPTRLKDTSKGRRIESKHKAMQSNDNSNEDKKTNSLQGIEDEKRVDSQDKTRLNSNYEHDFISEVDLNHADNVLEQEGSINTTIDTPNESIKRLPNTIIIGMKKGGTRALLEILKIHPSVQVCNEEVHFFDRDYNYQRGLEWYRNQMPASLPDQITVEKSPAYYVTSKVPERVYNMSPNVKLIVVVRDPTQRAISDYTQSLTKRPDNYPFETYAVKDLNKGTVNDKWMKIRIGLYAEFLEKWLEYFPLNQLLFVSGEELVKNPAREMQLVENFLKIKPWITENNFKYNETKKFYCLVGKRTASGVSKDEAHCMGKTKGRTHPFVRSAVITLLHEYFRPHNHKFYKMVKRDFGWP